MNAFSLLIGAVLSASAPADAQAGAVAQVDAHLNAAIDCAALDDMDFSNIPGAPTSITSAEAVAGDEETSDYCRIQGYVAPQVSFEIRLPTQGWNGRYFQVGCGGLCGTINIQNCADALAADFAVAANNMGHFGDSWGEPFWGGVPALRADYAGRSTHVTALAAKAIVTAYYGARPAYSYFRGCSTGGREGLYLAQHHPEDFDGIIAGDPAFPGRLGAFSNNWDANHLLDDDNRPVFGEAKLELLHEAVLDACDGLDGLEDRIIEDPRRCSFDPATLHCSNGTAGENCLTATQVAAAEALYAGPHNSAGVRLSPGAAPYGSELAWNGENRRSIASAYLRWLAFDEPRPDFSYRDFDWDSDPQRVRAQSALYDPVAPGTRPDLSAFQARGGRLIAYHGWADPGVPPESLLDYYAKIADDSGGYPAAQRWFRVFMVPGMHHCRGGDAPNTFDFLPSIVAWVERGEAPNGVVATQYGEDGSIQRTRPLYAYPTVARYSGSGDVDDAANWRPVTPEEVPNDHIDWLWAPGD